MAACSTRQSIRSDLAVTEELRIRDTRSIQRAREGHGGDGDQPTQEGTGFRDEEPGETAWDLAEPLSNSPPPSREQESGAQDSEEAPFPFPVFPGMGGEEEEAPKTPGLDIRRLARGVLKRLWLAAGIAFGIAVLFLVAAVTLVKPKWEAIAIVMVHTRQDEFSLGSAKPFESQDYNLKTMLDTIKLPSALLEVSDALGLNAAPRTLSPAIDVRTGKDSNLFQITATWNDSVVAANIANKVAEQLVERSRDLRHKDAEDAHANYAAQLEAARREMHTVTDEMRAFKATHQVSDFNAETQVLLDSLVRLETELNTKIAETEAMREARVDIDEAVKGEPEMVVTSTVYRNPLKTRLTDYEWQLQEARSRYTEQNPKVIKLQTRVDVLKQMIDESKDEGAPENLYSANTKLVALQDRQRELKSDIRIRDAQIAALSQTVQQTRAKLAALTEAERDFQLLRQRMTSAENLGSTLVGRVEEAKVVMLRNEAAFELFEAARPPTEPAPSPKKLIAAAGVVLGGGAGLFVVLLLEILDPLVRTRRDALGIPGVQLAWEFQQVPEGQYTLVDATEPGDPVAILFRRLLNDLDAKLDPEDWKCLGVTSADPKVGRTLVATNLAQALAMKEYQVILVDADLRRDADMRPADLFEIPPDRPGLLQALRGQNPIAALLRTAENPGLSLVTAGCSQPEQGAEAPSSGEPAEAVSEPALAGRPQGDDLPRLGSRQFRSVLDTLRQSGRHLVYDLPPIGTHETVLEAAASLGNVMLVARSGQTTRVQLREAAQLLEDRGAKVCGILVTDVRADLLEGAPLFPAHRKRREQRRWLRRSPSVAAHNISAVARDPDS
jgi:succinoglycan biosynthesis transport protein ExoP